VCGKDFSDGSKCHEGEDRYAYCTKDYLETFAPKCGSCQAPIVGPCMEAIGKKWHPDCFGCRTCHVHFTGAFFPGQDGFPYCEQHYYEAIGMVCDSCKRPIIAGKVVSFLDKKFHPEHFRCSHCTKNLVGEQYLKHQDKDKPVKPYCKPCHTALFG